MRYDWTRGGGRWRGLATRVSVWWVTGMAVAGCPLFVWEAVTADWTLVFPALVIGAGTVTLQLCARKVYGVREVLPARPYIKPFAVEVAEAVEAQRQAKWDHVAELAYRARPPDPDRLAAAQAMFPAAPRYAAAVAAFNAGTQTMQGMQAGLAQLASVMGGCAHRDAVPVDLLVTGERVAWVCPDCPAELPANWR